MKIYHNPRCSKSRQALQIIQENNQEVEIIEYLKSIPTAKELKSILKKLNVPASEIIRKGEKVFKETYKGKELSDDEWIEAMIKHPKLIERPIIIKGENAVVGRPPEKVKELF